MREHLLFERHAFGIDQNHDLSIMAKPGRGSGDIYVRGWGWNKCKIDRSSTEIIRYGS